MHCDLHLSLVAFVHATPIHHRMLTERFCDAGGVLVIVHCYLHRPSLVPFGHRIPVAPHYYLKLKSSDAICMVCPCPANRLTYTLRFRS